MLIRRLLILVFFATPFAVAAQDVRKAPDNDVVKITTTLIQIDVTVTDKKGDPVTDLTRDDIEIYENGVRQDITNFSFVSSNTAEPTAESANEGDVPVPDLAANEGKEHIGRTIALVVDDLTLSFESTYYVRKALRNFVDNQMQEGDLVAIIRTSGGIGALQQFTTNRELLRAAIEKVRWSSIGRGGIGAFAPITVQESGDQRLSAALGGDSSSGSQGRFDHDDNDTDDLREDFFANGTLGAVNYIVQGMSELPGRKSVLLLSDGLRINRFSTENRLRQARIWEAMERLVDLANRSSVVIYSVDARGLQTGQVTAGDSFTGATAASLIQPGSNSRIQHIFETQEGLSVLARLTGGMSFLNSNDLGAGIRKMLDDQSYYLVGYQPDEDVFDPEKHGFNDIEVKVNRKDVLVRYRGGFFGEKDEDRRTRLDGLSDSEKLVAALTSPLVVNDLRISLETIPRQDAKGQLTLISLLHIDLKDLKFTDNADGTKTGAFDLLAVNFGDNGLPVNSFNNSFSIKVKPEHFDALLKQGIVYSFEMPVKEAGAYQMRVAVRDAGSEKVGSATRFIQIPPLKKDGVVLSGIILDDVSVAEWEGAAQARASEQAARKEAIAEGLSPLADTAVRRFQRGTILKYSLEAYSGSKKGKAPSLKFRTRLIREGKIVFEGRDAPVAQAAGDGSVTEIAGALALPAALKTGDYALQIIVTAVPPKGKPKVTSRFVQFEVVE